MSAKPNFLDDYITVADRLAQFHTDHPCGRVVTYITEHDAVSKFVLVRAELYRAGEAEPAATGHGHKVGGESYIEKAETEAVGRALMLMGYETKRQAQRSEVRSQRSVRPAAISLLTSDRRPLTSAFDPRAEINAEIAQAVSLLGTCGHPLFSIAGDVPQKQRILRHVRSICGDLLWGYARIDSFADLSLAHLGDYAGILDCEIRAIREERPMAGEDVGF